jgi:hypothetical protein
VCLIVIVGDEVDEKECLNRYESWMVLVGVRWLCRDGVWWVGGGGLVVI